MRGGRSNLRIALVDPAEELLRRLAFNDERTLGMVLTRRAGSGGPGELGPKLEVLSQLAALLAVGAATPSLREVVEQATRTGASTREIVDVLVAVGPVVGVAGLVAAAPRLAAAIGYDLDDDQVPGPRSAVNRGVQEPGR